MIHEQLIQHYTRNGKKFLTDADGLILTQISNDTISRKDIALLKTLGENINLPPRMKWLKAATQEVDRMGDVMQITGAELENFRRNPQYIWMHGLTSEPIHTIGRIVRVVQTNDALYALAEYAPEGSSALADKVFALDANGYLPANSIGFRPIEWTPNDLGGYTFMKWELLEISKVELPANPSAIDE